MQANSSHPSGSFPHIEQTIRALGSEKALGDAFEWLSRFFLLNAPQYKGLVKQVWLWKD